MANHHAHSGLIPLAHRELLHLLSMVLPVDLLLLEMVATHHILPREDITRVPLNNMVVINKADTVVLRLNRVAIIKVDMEEEEDMAVLLPRTEVGTFMIVLV
jgi:hypothetical protein